MAWNMPLNLSRPAHRKLKRVFECDPIALHKLLHITRCEISLHLVPSSGQVIRPGSKLEDEFGYDLSDIRR